MWADIKKWPSLEDPNRYFSKEDIQMANRHMYLCVSGSVLLSLFIFSVSLFKDQGPRFQINLRPRKMK